MSENSIFDALIAEFHAKNDGFEESIAEILLQESYHLAADKSDEPTYLEKLVDVAEGIAEVGVILDEVLESYDGIQKGIDEVKATHAEVQAFLNLRQELIESSKRPVPSILNGSFKLDLCKSPISLVEPQNTEDDIHIGREAWVLPSFETEKVAFHSILSEIKAEANLATANDEVLILPLRVIVDVSKNAPRDFSKDIDGVLKKPFKKSKGTKGWIDNTPTEKLGLKSIKDYGLFHAFPKTGPKDDTFVLKGTGGVVKGRHGFLATEVPDATHKRSWSLSGVLKHFAHV